MTLPITVISGLDRVATYSAGRDLLLGDPHARLVSHCIDQIGVGLVSRTIEAGDGSVSAHLVDLAHGCVACTLREDVLPTLRALALEPGVDRVVLVLPEAVEPMGFLDNFHHVADEDGNTVADVCSVVAVVAMIDSPRLVGRLTAAATLADQGLAAGPGDDRHLAEVLVAQIESADVIVAPDATEQQRGVLRLLNAEASLPDRLPAHIDSVFDFVRTTRRTLPASLAEHSHDHREGDAWRVHWRTDRPLHPLRLLTALEQVGDVSLRGRGYLHLATRPTTSVEWDSAGRQLRLGAPDVEVRESGAWLNFVGIDERWWLIRDALDTAVLTDDEMAYAARDWQRIDDPFAGLWSGPGDGNR
ncbi:MAG: GTP-binding protein [Actinobacteria bacterium]|nr:GTP-binding protein [Actinomycetota bacterium]